MEERFFTDEQLRDMERRTVDRLTDAIEAGDTDKAKKIAKRMYSEFLSMHDLYRNWITATLSEVAERHGDKELEEIMVEGVRAWWKPIIDSMPKEPEAMPSKIKMFVSGLHGHLQPLSITEDEQHRRIEKRKKSPLTYWKFSPNDERALSYYDEMTTLKNACIDDDWIHVDYNNKKAGIENFLRELIFALGEKNGK